MLASRRRFLLTAMLLAVPAPGRAQAPAPATPPAPANPPQVLPAQLEGVEVTLEERTFVYIKGSGDWDVAFHLIVDSIKSVQTYLDRQGVKPSGPPLTVYVGADDSGFIFQAGLPVSEPLKNPPRGDLAMGKTPAGKAYKFIHRGPYDKIEETYEAITNFLDERRIEAQDTFIEQYPADVVNTPPDKLVVEIYVPIRP